MALPVVVLPQPDSPTSASVSPARDVEGHLAHGVEPAARALQQAAADGETHRQVLHLQQASARPGAARAVALDPAAVPPRPARVPPPPAGRAGVQQAAHLPTCARAPPATPAAWWRSATMACAQRGAKRQPTKSASAAAPCRRWLPAPGRAGRPPAVRAAARAHTDAWAAKNSAAGATSMICPAYISATRCAMPDTTARSCVISSRPMRCSRCRSFSRSRICAWMVTSSAVVGSSATRKSGSAASVMAIITRCFWPPLMRKG
jgi:hypothetical protein